MATVTRQVGEFESGICIVQIDYDDVSFNILMLRVINNGAAPIRFIATRQSDGKTFGQVFNGNQTFEIAVPKNGANAITFTNLGLGKWGGVSWMTQYPA